MHTHHSQIRKGIFHIKSCSYNNNNILCLSGHKHNCVPLHASFTCAVGGEDFTDGAFTVSFPTGLALPATVCTYLNATDDSVVEGEHTFTVLIESINLSTGLSLSAASTQQTAVILDNDGIHVSSCVTHKYYRQYNNNNRFFKFSFTPYLL